MIKELLFGPPVTRDRRDFEAGDNNELINQHKPEQHQHNQQQITQEGDTYGYTTTDDGYIYNNTIVYDDVDYNFFDQLEHVYGFRTGELIELYTQVRSHYALELKMIDNNPINVKKAIDIFIHKFLYYILLLQSKEEKEEEVEKQNINIDIEKTDKETMFNNTIAFYRIIHQTESNSCYTVDSECQTFLVDSRLDHIYSYIMEKAFMDILKRKCEELYLDSNTDDIYRMVNILQQNQSFYRERAKKNYNGCAIDGSDHMHIPCNANCSNGWVIYTKKTSSFYLTCVKRFIRNPVKQPLFTFSNESLKIEYIPFQQVLLLCGNNTDFINRYCERDNNEKKNEEEEEYDSSNIKLTKEVEQGDNNVYIDYNSKDEWVSLPIVFYLLWQALSFVPIEEI